MNNTHLDNLVSKGSISSYEYENMDENGEIGKVGAYRNSQRLTFHFPNGESLTIDCFCSGSSEDTELIISGE